MAAPNDAISRRLIGEYRSARVRFFAEKERLASVRMLGSSRSRSIARADDDSSIAQSALVAHWAANGWDEAGLEHLLREVDYRAEVQAMFGVSYSGDGMTRERARQEKLAEELREYWLASGHDLRDLDRVLAEAERDAFDLIPK